MCTKEPQSFENLKDKSRSESHLPLGKWWDASWDKLMSSYSSSDYAASAKVFDILFLNSVWGYWGPQTHYMLHVENHVSNLSKVSSRSFQKCLLLFPEHIEKEESTRLIWLRLIPKFNNTSKFPYISYQHVHVCIAWGVICSLYQWSLSQSNVQSSLPTAGDDYYVEPIRVY